jgi:hypothetical protein
LSDGGMSRRRADRRSGIPASAGAPAHRRRRAPAGMRPSRRGPGRPCSCCRAGSDTARHRGPSGAGRRARRGPPAPAADAGPTPGRGRPAHSPMILITTRLRRWPSNSA